MSRLYWDTNLFIYLWEEAEPHSDLSRKLLIRMRERRDGLLTSTFTLGELLVKPLQADPKAYQRYERYFESAGVDLVPFDKAAARMYGQIRQDKSIRAPDAIQLACAAAAEADMFITNDDRLSRKTIPGIDFIVPLDRAYL